MAELTTKQRRFVEEYCVDFNAAQAAIRAGYAKTRARQTGYDNVTNRDISEAIKKRLDELAMTAEEATKRLGDIARGSVDPFLEADEKGIVQIHLGTDAAKANYNLLKKVKQKRHITTVGDVETEHIDTEFEIYDAKSALVDILRMHGKFVDRLDVTSDGKPITKLTIDRGNKD